MSVYLFETLSRNDAGRVVSYGVVWSDGADAPNDASRVVSYAASSPNAAWLCGLCSLGYLLPLERLCVWQRSWQLAMSVAPPLDHAVTWSASISERL